MSGIGQEGMAQTSAGSEEVQDTGILNSTDIPREEHCQINDMQDATRNLGKGRRASGAEREHFNKSGTTLQGEDITDEKRESALEAVKIQRPSQDGNEEVDPSFPVEASNAAEEINEKDDSSPEPTTDELILSFKKGRRGRYVPVPAQKLRNNLSPSVGYLEFANATDFAANVWNTIPVPTFAAVLMGLGGASAIILSFFALKDSFLCWHNIKLLRKERAELLAAMDDEEKAQGRFNDRSLNVKLEVNRRELGQEIVDRLSMDAFMGFSAIIVGVGTLMAIGGANPRVYHASNLLSGYIGNSPSAVWGIGNSLWSAYLFRRASRHSTTGTRDIRHEGVKAHLKKRTSSVQIHSLIMGIATFVSAPAGMVTATHWQGYPPLIPCIILAKWGNMIWRRRLGYTRFPMRADSPSVNLEDLISELEWTIDLQEALRKGLQTNLQDYIRNNPGQGSITAFMSRCGLLEDLCVRLLNTSAIVHNGNETMDVDQMMVEECERTVPSFAATAGSIFQLEGRRALAYKERYLLELLGANVNDASTIRRLSVSG